MASSVPLFDVKVVGEKELSITLARIRSAIQASMGKGLIENYLLKKTKSRFAEAGDNPFAQRAPSGQYWSPPKNSTLRRRKYNRYNPKQALVDSGGLRDSIKVYKRQGMLAIGVTGGLGKFSVGINPNSKHYKKGLLHQNGGTNPQGARIPPRPFIGLGRSDIKDIEEIIQKEVDRI